MTVSTVLRHPARLPSSFLVYDYALWIWSVRPTVGLDPGAIGPTVFAKTDKTLVEDQTCKNHSTFHRSTHNGAIENIVCTSRRSRFQIRKFEDVTTCVHICHFHVSTYITLFVFFVLLLLGRGGKGGGGKFNNPCTLNLSSLQRAPFPIRTMSGSMTVLRHDARLSSAFFVHDHALWGAAELAAGQGPSS
jgi:hypothetical protein